MRPSRSFLELSSPPTLEQCSWSNMLRFLNNSVIFHFNCPAILVPKFLMQMVSRANTAQRCGRTGHFSPQLPQAGFAVGQPHSCKQTWPNCAAQPRASLIDVELSRCWTCSPRHRRARLCPLPGGCSETLSLVWRHTCRGMECEPAQGSEQSAGQMGIMRGWEYPHPLLLHPKSQQDEQQTLPRLKAFLGCQHSSATAIHTWV